jgi:hypothetical protein
MEHPIHERIKNLILTGKITRKEIVEKLNISKRTLVTRLSLGDWLLSEVIALEAIYSVKLLVVGAEYYQDDKNNEVNDLAHTFDAPVNYKINVQIDAEKFTPQDLDALNKELTERLLLKFRSRN